jgi:lipopolysaccharide assembly outer membrane protein LptD (OstA)
MTYWARPNRLSMKIKSLFLGVAISASVMAADASKILLRGSSVDVEKATATGSARATVGDMTVAADAITFEKGKNALRCEGAVTIRIAGNVINARDCAIELGAGEKKLFFLSQGNIRLSDSTYVPSESTDLIGRKSDREKVIQDFKARSEASKDVNQVTEPTP